MAALKGIRVYPNKDGFLDNENLRKFGAYGRVTRPVFEGNDHPAYVRAAEIFKRWQVTSPDGTQASLNPEVHTVEEHEDGTITVTPSIWFNQPHGWHGWLTRGIWRSV
jgi:Family of unknown function (DUF6527)